MNQFTPKEIALRFLFYVLGAFLVITLFCPTCWVDNFNLSLISALIALAYFVFLSEGNGIIMLILDRFYTWKRSPRKRFYISVFFISIYTLIFIITINVIIAFFLEHKNFDTLFSNDFYMRIMTNLLIAIIITLGIFVHNFLLKWEEMAAEQEITKNKKLYATIESLQNQIKPHFLFNNLNAVTSIIPNDPDAAIHFIHQLSKVYRYILDQQQEELVTLQTELDFAESYLYLHEIRYGKKLQSSFEVHDNAYSLPPFTLQLLIENAIKHNIISKSKPLSITIKQDKEQLIIENNLQPKAAEGASWGIGLNNIKDRYKLLTENEINIIENKTHFSVTVPLLKLS